MAGAIPSGGRGDKADGAVDDYLAAMAVGGSTDACRLISAIGSDIASRDKDMVHRAEVAAAYSGLEVVARGNHRAAANGYAVYCLTVAATDARSVDVAAADGDVAAVLPIKATTDTCCIVAVGVDSAALDDNVAVANIISKTKRSGARKV